MPIIDYQTYASFGGQLEARVAAFMAALDAHRYTIDVPAPTENQLVEWIARNGGMSAVEIEPAPEPEPEPPPLTVDQLCARIDAEAETARLQYITPGSGQAMVYSAKQAEARAYQAAGEPADLTGYPLLAVEVGITAPTAAEIAALWLAMEAQWIAAAADIEALRLGAKAAVRAAATQEEREAAAVVAWPSPTP